MSRTKSIINLTYAANFLCLIGLSLSVYGFIVETSIGQDPGYKPSCDINDIVSCSRVFNSRFAKGLGLVGDIFGEDHWLNQKNVVYGLFIYTGLFLLSMSSSPLLVTVTHACVIVLNIFTVYLAAILVHLQAVCVVCVATYIVNALLLFVSVRRRAVLRQAFTKKRA